VVNKWINDSTSAEDVLQNIFLCIIRSIKNFRGDSDVSSWIYKIAQNECFRHLGKLKRERENFADNDVYFLPEENVELRPDTLTESLERREKLNEIIARLEPERRAVISLYYYSGMNTTEMAKALNIPPNTVYTRLKRARDDIKAMLNREDPEGL
jgi:RNA polymerase sigma-70 factor (ECF subfamily)